MLSYGNKERFYLGDKVVNIKTNKKGVVVEGKILSHNHILWEDGSRSDLNNAIENHKIRRS
ncbi:MAG: hypothetical protein PHW89_07905 [Sulfurimonas denitrificans]|nr:hypothetical protein [Sulfurimonas denitrificans]